MSLELLEFMTYVTIALAIYFIPTWIAAFRNHTSGGGIFVINLFLGWTFLGWVVALAWAASGVHPPPAKS